jgi:glycosyltransferase involved in cell wall biosynthesis
MTICHITSMHSYDDDRIFERACRGLVDIGYKVKLIATFKGNETLSGIEIIGLKKRSGIKRRIFSSFEAYRKARKQKADIYHFHDPDLLPWMLLLSCSGRKVVYDVHENYESRIVKFPMPNFLRNTFRKVYRQIENMIASKLSGVTVVTESMRKLFNRINTPIILTDNVIYKKRLEHINIIFHKNSDYIIYTSGTHSSARNCMQTIDALPLILQQVPGVQMWFVGRYYPDNYKNILWERARELNVHNFVKIEGMLPWEENFIRTATAHIGCVFYQDNLNNRVTLPNRLYEYMYCGVAVLGENFPEVKRVLEHSKAGLCVNSNDKNSIAEKAVYLLKNKDKMIEMGNNGRKAVLENYNFENELLKLDTFYKSII